MPTKPSSADATNEFTIDDLATMSGTPSRTIREYQTMGVLPAPERRGRSGIYREGHLRRLKLIGDLQERGYSLAGIRDLLQAWSGGADLSDVLGLVPDDLVHLDEPGAPATLTQLAFVLPALIPERLDDVFAVGLVDLCGPDVYCIPSPSLLQLTVDLLDHGYPAAEVLSLLGTINSSTAKIAEAARRLIADPPPKTSAAALDALASRGRGLLAHAAGRMTIYNLGRTLPSDAPGRKTTRRG